MSACRQAQETAGAKARALLCNQSGTLRPVDAVPGGAAPWLRQALDPVGDECTLTWGIDLLGQSVSSSLVPEAGFIF